MTTIILHHYPTSPWAEAVRLALGLKKLEWGSVTAPVVMPKPELAVLTGGYARIPVLQSGADIFCDSAAAMDALETLHPEPSLYPAPLGQGHRLLAAQAGGATFFAAVGSALGNLPIGGNEEFWADREKRFGMKEPAFRAMAPHLATQFRAYLGLLEATLSDGRSFLGGDAAGHGDLANYQLIWFQDFAGPGSVAAIIQARPQLGAWLQRVEALGHGTPRDMRSEEAIAVARDAEPTVRGIVDPASGFSAGQQVLVSQEASKDAPTEGRLAVLTDRRISLLRDHPAVGTVAVHFPRAGQVVMPA
ncbi:glutathione S-transferase family protein [Sandaracinobacteroides hominis]|uniref:glutathione S-transferase family protein n=1 Tax=Sandaracinobacteroides hominis TaxID=2780086 RepID=UPI0018F5A8C5|nr:glutathione S-transferase family protein [Sandaracinobacteroides hominis]